MSRGASDFLANAVKHGGFRPNRFEVILMPPSAAGFDTESARFKAKATTEPGHTLGQAVLNYFGKDIKLPGDYDTADWSCTMIMDDFSDYEAMVRWHNMMLGYASNTAQVDSPLEYMGSATVRKLSRKDEVLSETELLYIWPSAIGEIALDHSDKDTVSQFEVTFTVNSIKTPGSQ